MKKDLRKNNGAVFLMVIIIIVIASAAGFAAFLGIRMAVTGEEFLAPLREWGWLEEKEEDKENEDKATVSEPVSDEVKEKDVTHYQIKFGVLTKIGLQSFYKASAVRSSYYDDYEEDENIYGDLMEKVVSSDSIDDLMNLDLYAKKNEIVEIDVVIDFETFLKDTYDIIKKDKQFKDELKDNDIEDLDDFEKYIGQYIFNNEGDKLEDFISEDMIIDLLFDEMNLEEIGITEKEIKKNLDLDVDGNYAEIKLTFSDDMNDAILEAIEDLADELNDIDYDDEDVPDYIKNFKISKKSYVKDIVDYWNGIIDLAKDNGEYSEMFGDNADMLDDMKIKTVK